MLHYLQGLLAALDLTSLMDAVLRVAAIFLCLTVHETCHGLAALALGDPTAKRMHRLSFNPLHHIDWLGLLSMFLCGFGWALTEGVRAAVAERGLLGAFTGGLTAGAAGTTAAVFFGCLAAVLAKSRDKS